MKIFNVLAISVSAVFLFAGPVYASGQAESLAGLDVQLDSANLKSGYGGEAFSKKLAPQFNIFIGHYFSKFLGFELGYQQNVTKKHTDTVQPNTNYFGITGFSTIASQGYTAKKSLHGINFNYVPSFKLGASFDIVAVLGLSYMRAKANMQLVSFDGTAATAVEQSDYNLNFTSRKVVPRLGFRLQYLLHKKIGLRASYIWENTALLKPTANRNLNPSQSLQAKFKNSSTIGVGAFYRF